MASPLRFAVVHWLLCKLFTFSYGICNSSSTTVWAPMFLNNLCSCLRFFTPLGPWDTQRLLSLSRICRQRKRVKQVNNRKSTCWARMGIKNSGTSQGFSTTLIQIFNWTHYWGLQKNPCCYALEKLLRKYRSDFYLTLPNIPFENQ